MKRVVSQWPTCLHLCAGLQMHCYSLLFIDVLGASTRPFKANTLPSWEVSSLTLLSGWLVLLVPGILGSAPVWLRLCLTVLIGQLCNHHHTRGHLPSSEPQEGIHFPCLLLFRLPVLNFGFSNYIQILENEGFRGYLWEIFEWRVPFGRTEF